MIGMCLIARCLADLTARLSASGGVYSVVVRGLIILGLALLIFVTVTAGVRIVALALLVIETGSLVFMIVMIILPGPTIGPGPLVPTSGHVVNLAVTFIVFAVLAGEVAQRPVATLVTCGILGATGPAWIHLRRRRARPLRVGVFDRHESADALPGGARVHRTAEGELILAGLGTGSTQGSTAATDGPI